MTSHYITDCWKLDGALRDLHEAAAAMKDIHPMRLHGDAQWIWEDVCDLIEVLQKITTFVPDKRVEDMQLALQLLDLRRQQAALEAAE